MANFFTRIRLMCCIALLLSIWSTGKGWSHEGHSHSGGKEEFSFIRNMGQWSDPFNYKAQIPGGTMYLTSEGLLYDFVNTDDMNRINKDMHAGKNVDNYTINRHAYKVKFLNKNANTSYEHNARRAARYSYFMGNDPAKWKSDVGAYGEIVEKNIYNGIDLIVNCEQGNIKYDFKVAPNADPALIRVGFEGVTPVVSKSGELVFETTVNTVKEKAPYVYQEIEGRRVEVVARYKLDKGILTFEFPEGYNTAYELVIDPDLVFSTFSGATSSNAYAYSTTYDITGALYIGADAWSVGWPVTIGAFQTTYGGGGHELAINKFNSLGTALIYSTYLGGNNWELATSMWVFNDELYLFGGTNSSNFPTTTNAFSTVKNGTWDAFVARLSDDGTQLLGSTFIGGSGDEVYQAVWGGGNINLYDISSNQSSQLSPGDISVDEMTGNIWVTTNTNSTNFPTTSNAPILNNAGGWDVVVFALNANCSQLMYSTYFGGSGNEAPHSLLLSKNGLVYVVGATLSSNLPVPVSALNPVNQGLVDGFVMSINKTTGNIDNATYIGTADGDIVAHIQEDDFDNIYILGRTNGNYPISPNVWVGNASGSVFIDILDSSLTTRSLSTRLASNGYIPSAFLVDDCGNLYVGGFGASRVAGYQVTANAYDSDNQNRNFWFCTIGRNFSELIYASFFGESSSDHSHIGRHRFDPEGIIYHSICCNIGGNPATTNSNSYSRLKQTSGQDVLSFKFNFEKVGVSSVFEPDRLGTPMDSFCAPHTVDFTNNSQQAIDFIWYFGDGDSSLLRTPSHTYTQAGIYEVMLVAINDTMCITHDTAIMYVHVYEVEVPQLRVVDTNLCVALDSLLITVDVLNPSSGVPGNVFRWQAGGGGAIHGDNNTQSVWIRPAGTFTVTVLDSVAGVCTRSATATVNVNMTPRILDILTPDTAVCVGDIVPIRARGSDGYTYRWQPTIGLNDSTLLEPQITVNRSQLYMVTASYPYCIDTSDMINITMHEYPVVEVTAPSEACEGSEVRLRSDVSPYRNDYIYTWSNTGSAILPATNVPNVSFLADTVDRMYYLKVETPIGCSDSVSKFIVFHAKGNGDAISGAEYCAPGSAQLWAMNGASYQWDPAYGLDDPTSATPVTNVSTNTNYKVYITDDNNCVDTLEVAVQVHPRAVLSLPKEITVYPGEGYQAAPETNALYFEWFPPSGLSNPDISDPYILPAVRTRYVVTARTENGCEVTDSMDVLVGDPEIGMPNAYNPTNPEARLFKPVVRGGWDLKSFRIYNRWGTLIYESSDIRSGWDGTFNNAAQPFGVYVWIIEAVNANGETYQQTGNVTLIR